MGLDVSDRSRSATSLPLTPTSGKAMPMLARILRSSGDRLADQAIVSSLYRWRATGKRLTELTGDQTANVRLRIMITGRR